MKARTERDTMTHNARLLAAAIEVHCILMDLEDDRAAQGKAGALLDELEQLQKDASEATIRRLMPDYFMEDAQ